ncbi:sialic acid-specific 9-O-acetylesterase domain protein [Bacteroides fragilis str. 3397 T10]|nr:sialic acid-specific 9-O-acetylesterase domain protein [Bacteroides fragilis str. 3397 T10]
MYIKVKTKGYEKQMYASCNFTDLVRYSICKNSAATYFL